MTVSIAVRAAREIIAGLWPDPTPLRCGIAVCGGGRLGVGMYWPIDRWTIPARCGLARCGASFCNRIVPNDGIFAGMLPVMYSHHVTMGLTELPGGRADPRQRFVTAYDNPSMTLHIVGDELEWLDEVADKIMNKLDRTSHITTSWGTVNTLSIGPPRRDTRRGHPRYDVQMTIDMEMVRA